MIVIKASRWLAEKIRRPSRWLALGALAAFGPKCVVCVAAYVGIGAALGLGGSEICGAPANSSDAWMSWLLIPGIVLGFSGFLSRRWLSRTLRVGKHG
jgi:hypothetical protein